MSSKQTGRTVNIVTGIIFLVFGIFIFLVAPSQTSSGYGQVYGSSFFPRFLGAVIAVLAGLQLVRELLTPPAGPAKKQVMLPLPVLITLLICIAYVFLMQWLGYLISTVLVIAGLMVYFRVGRFWLHAGIVVTTTAVLYLFFAKVLGVVLPQSPFGF